MAIENNQNQNLPLNPGESSRYVYLSPPLPVDQTNILQLNEEMNRRSREADMAAIGTNILLNPAFCSNLFELIQRYMAIGLTPGQSSRSAHLLPPFPGDQTNILIMNPAFCSDLYELIQRYMALSLTPGQSSCSAHLSFPLPGDQTNILRSVPRLLQYPNMQPQYGLQFHENGDSTQRTNVGGSPQIDPLSYFTLDDPDVNTPFAMEDCWRGR